MAERTFTVGRTRITVGNRNRGTTRDGQSMGRFGGGWDYHLGAQWTPPAKRGGRWTLIVFYLVGSARFNFRAGDGRG